MSGQDRFLWGMFGACLPEILRFYKIITGGQVLPEFTWPYVLISAAFIFAAGIFTVAWEPENRFKAIWVGISFPVLVSTMLQATPTLPGK